MRTKHIIIFLACASIGQAQYTPPSGGGGGAVSSVFTRTGAVTASTGDYTAAQVTNAADTTSTYSNPGWITALDAAKLTGTINSARLPTTFSIAGPITLSGSGAGNLSLANGTTPTAPASGNQSLFFDSANSNHLSAETSAGAVRDLESGGLTGTPPTSGWTVQNSSVGFVDNWNGANGISLGILNNSTNNLALLTRSITVPYTIIGHFHYFSFNTTSACGLHIFDGTKTEGIEVLNLAGSQLKLRIVTETALSSPTESTIFGPTAGLVGYDFAAKVVNDGTHRTWFHYVGGAWVQDLQEATGAFLTETTAGIGGINATATSSNASCLLDYWTVQ